MSNRDTVQAPKFRVDFIGRPTLSPFQGIDLRLKKPGILDLSLSDSADISKDVFNDEINVRIIEVTINETMSSATSFTIKIIDPDMDYMSCLK